MYIMKILTLCSIAYHVDIVARLYSSSWFGSQPELVVLSHVLYLMAREWPVWASILPSFIPPEASVLLFPYLRPPPPVVENEKGLRQNMRS
jgi:hypothetical protein